MNALYFGGVPYLHNTDVGGGWTPKATMWGGIAVSYTHLDVYKRQMLRNILLPPI